MRIAIGRTGVYRFPVFVDLAVKITQILVRLVNTTHPFGTSPGAHSMPHAVSTRPHAPPQWTDAVPRPAPTPPPAVR